MNGFWLEFMENLLYAKQRAQLCPQDVRFGGFPSGSVVKNPPASARDMRSIPDPGRSHMSWSN